MITTTKKAAPEKTSSPDPVDIHVGVRLRLRRKLLGLSQEQLGRASGLTFQQIQKYERGTNRIGASRLFAFSQLLGVSVSYFFDEAKASKTSLRAALAPGFSEEGQGALENAPRGATELLQRKETLDLIRAYYRIQARETRRKVLALIKSMSE